MIRLCWLILFSSSVMWVHGQDPIFSQYYMAPLQLNPAFAGNTTAPKFAINYRNQWPNLNQAYVTYAVSYDQFFDDLNSGLGLFILADDAGRGLFRNYKISGVYAYRARLVGNLYAKWGIEIGFIQTRVNWDKLIFPDQLDPELGPVSPGGLPYPTAEVRPDDQSKTVFDASVGALAYSPKWYAGVTLKHLNNPSEDLLGKNDQLRGGLPLRLSVHGGTEIHLLERRLNDIYGFVSPNIMFVKQGEFTQLTGGAYFGYGMYFMGAWYRHTFNNPDAVIASAGVQSGILRISYSYDITISQLSLRSGGSHELGIMINLENLDGRPRDSKYNDCFQIFR